MMRYRLLGPLEVVGDDGATVALGGDRERVLLGTLILGSNQVVSTSRLIDALWGEDPPPTAANTLQVHVSKLRKKLAGNDNSERAIESSSSGYLLRTGPDDVDLRRYEELVGQTPADPAEESALLHEALELWRGPALADVSSDLLAGDRARLDELRLVTLERRIEADLALGRHGELVGELEVLLHDHPLRDRFRRQLMVALYRSGRQADALAIYSHGREVLAEELGIDPSPALQKLELAILNQAPELDLSDVSLKPSSKQHLPTGTVTFLFTDIEGSTRLWEDHPDAMAQALRRHDEILRTSIEASGGYVFKTVGDAFCAAFESATPGLEAARAAQWLLSAERWPAPVELRVRMALHTGSSEERDGDYFGPITLNRIARLIAVAHGGQTVVSLATAELVHDRLPEDLVLRNLGEHRLKDLSRPERIFQLEADGLTAEFPPLRSLDNSALRNNLPIQLTSFVGREDELKDIRSLMDQSRLVTLTGAGGSGKTRLALQVAAEALENFDEGTWLIELASLGDPGLVAGAVASTLGVREQPGHPLLETLGFALSDRPILLVLDNCEHVLDACAQMTSSLLRSCSRLSILATSREPLAVPGEHVYRVPSLSVPSADQAHNADRASGFEAIRLFTDRAVAVQPAFVLNSTNAEVAASICRRLDGMPLAIELATARLSSLSVDEIDKRLDERFRLLTGKARTVVPRQQTLRALIDWSYDLLDDNEQAVLCRLSVFAGGWTLEAAETVCSREDLEFWEVVDVLGSLVNKNLAQIEPAGTSPRYRLLETVREYAARRLAERGLNEETLTHERHAQFFLVLAEQAGPHFSGSEQARWFDLLRVELDNIRAAIAHLGSSASTIDQALRMGIALRDFWFCGLFSQGIEALEEALSHPTPSRLEALRGLALVGTAYLHFEQGDYAMAQSRFAEAAEIGKAACDPAIEAEALGGLSLLVLRQGDIRSASEMIQMSVDLAEVAGVPYILAEAFNHRGQVRLACNDAEARADFDEALVRFQEIDNLFGIRWVLQSLAMVALKEGDFGGARANIEMSLHLRRVMHRDAGFHASLNLLGIVELLDGDIPAAREAFGDLLMVARHLGARPFIGFAHLGLAFCATATGDFSRAVLLHGAADSLFESLGEALDVDLEAYRQHDHRLLRRSLGDTEFDSAYKSGRSLTPEEAVSLAISE